MNEATIIRLNRQAGLEELPIFKVAQLYFLRILDPRRSPSVEESQRPSLRDLGNFFGVDEVDIVRAEESECTSPDTKSRLLAETVARQGYRLPRSCQKLSTQIVDSYGERQQHEPDRKYTMPLLSVLTELKLEYDLTIDRRGDYYLLTLPGVQKMIIVNNTSGDTFVLHLPPDQDKNIIGLNKNKLKVLQRNARQPQEILTALTMVQPAKFKQQLRRALNPEEMANPEAVDVRALIESQPHEKAPPNYRTFGGLRTELSIHDDTMMGLVQEVAAERGLIDYRDMLYLYLNSTNRLTYYLPDDVVARIKEKNSIPGVERLDPSQWGTIQEMVEQIRTTGITGHRATIASDVERIADDFEAERLRQADGDEDGLLPLRADGAVRGTRPGTIVHYRRGELWDALVERTLQFYEQLEIQPGELELAAIVHHIQYHYGVVKRYRGVSSDIDALIERLQDNDKEIYKARRIQPDDRRKLWYYSPKAIQRLGEQYKAEYESYPEIPEGWIDFDVLLERLTKNLTTEHKITDVAQVKEQIRQFRRIISKQKNINIYLQKCRANGHIRLYYSPVAYEAIYSQCVRGLK